ncbi:MAG: GNAT family N-acetyltransferase [Blastocatellia bacterium]|nr:GNAT family N-acetyltransferase [Blastocatellia bacterium]
MQPQPSLVLMIDDLKLRPLELNDLDLIWPDISDPEISKYMAWEAHTDKAQTLAFLQGEITRRESGQGMTWGIFKDGAFCGIVSLIALTRSHRALTYNKAELAYWLGRAHQGQGIMTAAVQRVMQFAFQELGLHKLCVSHFGVNEASQRLIQRCGFRYVGEQIEEFQKDGIWHSHHLYELLDREFRAAQANQR